MGVSGGPKIKRDGLIFSIDAGSSLRGYSRVGTAGPSNSSNSIRDLVNKIDCDLQNSGYIGGVDLYTLYGITYPEGSYSPANRDGITPGFNDTSSGKVYDCSRALNYFVYDDDSSSWVPDSYFRGLRIGGHCYDNYDAASYVTELTYFIEDYNKIKVDYPNATHILIGSHACDRYNVGNTLEILADLGAPADVLTWGNGRREFVLVGKPGLGAGNAYGWAYENEQGGAVSHLNIAIPYENSDGYLSLSGGQYFDIPNSAGMLEGDGDFTIEAYYYLAEQSGGALFVNYGPGYTSGSLWFSGQYGVYIDGSVYVAGAPLGVGTYHMVATRELGNAKIYLNGVQSNEGSLPNPIVNNGQDYRIGCDVNGTAEPFSGKLYSLRVYDKAMSASEVLRSYKTHKKRFGL